MTAPTAFLVYLEALPATLLSPGFRERISAREQRGEYPFSVQNIYRVLFAASAVLRRGWVTVAATGPLDPDDPALGTSLRCFRYLHAVLLDPAPGEGAAVAALAPIAARAMRVTTRPACFCPPCPAPHQGGGVPVDDALRLATTLRQYADVRWLGQHDQGFAGMPPQRHAGGELAYARCFGRLPAVIGLPSLEVTVTYRPPPEAQISFDPFRGEMTLPPPRQSAIRAHVTSPATGPLGEHAVKQLLGHAVTALRHAPAEQPADRAAAEIAVSGFFSRELCDVAAARGIDPQPWKDEITARLVGAARRDGRLTEAYLDALEQAATTWRELACAGS